MQKLLKLSAVTALVLTLGACGGGGGSGVGSAGPVTFQGTAATGAPMANAPVFIKDAQGREPTGQNEAAGTAVVTTDANGSFSIPPTILAGLTAPYIVRTTGKVVLDSGDDAVVTLHSLITPGGSSTVNITPLTEAGTLLATGKSTTQAFDSAATALANVTTTSMASSNRALMSAIGGASAGGLNVFTSDLDARQTSDLSNPSTAKAHDLLLDSLSMSYSRGQLVLADRNRPADAIDTAPRVLVSAGADPATAGGTMQGADSAGFLSATQLNALVQRFNDQLRAGCTIPLIGAYSSTCSGVFSAGSSVFSAQYKNEGTSAVNWLKQWVSIALDTEDLSAVTVSVSVPYRGSYVIPGTSTRVTRVILKFENANGDSVRRPILLTKVGETLVAYGDQKDYFVWIRPRVSIAPDADDTYPYYPRYEAGLNLVIKSHYAGVKGAVVGAQVKGPGLPTGRSTARERFPNELQNRNGISDGVELFDNTAQGCSNLSLDPSVYVSKNTTSWADAWNAYKAANYSAEARNTLYSGIIRWRSTSTTCAPMFDFRRFYLASEQFTLPKKGDTYNVTLYLDKTLIDSAGVTLPSGATAATVKNQNDTTVNVYKLPIEVKLSADAMDTPTSIPDTARPGVTDATRQALLTAAKGADRTVSWTRNRVFWPEGNGANGQPINTPFINFSAGVFQSAYDQYRTVDSYSGPTVASYKKYSDYLGGDEIRSMCGKTLATHQGSAVKVYIQKKTRASTDDVWGAATFTSCPDRLVEDTVWNNTSKLYVVNAGSEANLVGYVVFAARDRLKYQVDRSTLVTENQTSRTLSWRYLLSKEPANSKALCSSYDGYWGYRQAYVNMIDINGRMISERREVYGDYPNLAASLLGDSTDVNAPDFLRAVEVTRPRMDTDSLYLPFTINTAGFTSVTNFNIGKKGIIHAAQSLSGESCVP